jgi:hypothetical protein
MEQDKGDPDFYRDEVDALVTAAIAIAGALGVGVTAVAIMDSSKSSSLTVSMLCLVQKMILSSRHHKLLKRIN